MVNMLPVKPLDGGYVFENLISKYAGAYTGVIVKIVSVTALLLLVSSIVAPFVI